MPSSVQHPDDEVIILSSDDGGNFQNDRGSDQFRILEMAPTDSEEFSDEVRDSQSPEAEEGLDTDSSESLPCIVQCRSPKERVKITAADSRTKAEPADSKVSNDDRTIGTERNVRREVKTWNCKNSFRLVKDKFSPREPVIHRTESTVDNRAIDQKEKFDLAAETVSSTSREFDPVFELNEALRDLLYDYGNKANDVASDIDISTSWYSREKTFHEDGLSITLSDDEIQRRNHTKAEIEAIISAATALTRQFDPEMRMSRQQCKEYMLTRLTEYGETLHQIVHEMDEKTTKALPAAKKDNESAIKGTIKNVYKATKDI